MVFLLSAATAFAIVVHPTSLAPGDQYRLAFVTSTGRDATSSNIDDYNSFVTTVAELVPELSALGTTWKAIASTEFVDAVANTDTVPLSQGGSLGVPIFLLNDTKLVDSNDDLWVLYPGGMLDTPLNVNESGSFVVSAFVWTGTQAHGRAAIGHLGYGSGTGAMVGSTADLDHDWIYAAQRSPLTDSYLFYALSDTLIVPDPIPEPSTLVLFGLGFLGLVGYVYRRKRRFSD